MTYSLNASPLLAPIIFGLLEIEWVIAGIVSADKLVDRGFLEV
jgi:hypothetical protein